MSKIIIYLFCLILLICECPSAYAGDFAYLTTYAYNGPPKLLQLDATNDAILNEIDLPYNEALGDMLIDENGGCFLSSYRLVDRHGRKLFYYDSKTRKLQKFMNLDGIFGPNQMALNGNELIVIVEGNDRTRLKSGVLFIDRQKKRIDKEIFLGEDDPKYVQYNILDSSFDGSRYLVITTFNFIKEEYPDQYVNECMDFGDVIVIDTIKKEIAKVINVPRLYRSLMGVCIVNDKIYVTAQTKGIPKPSSEMYPDGGLSMNTDLLVFSLAKGALISKIKVSPNPFDLVYDRTMKKLFVFHTSDRVPRNTVEIIDVKTDKVIATLEAPAYVKASMVAPHRMYLCLEEVYWDKNIKPKIQIIDTNTNKVIKEMNGRFKDISVNLKY